MSKDRLTDPLSKNASTSRLLLTIHGVGDPVPGGNSQLLADALRKLGLELKLDEVHWNNLVSKPDADFVFNYVRKLSGAIMEAICLPVVPSYQKLGKWPRTLGKIVEWFSILCAMLVPLPLYFLTLLMWSCSPLPALKILGGILFATFAIATALGVLSFNREIFWGSIRVGLLPSLWTPLGIMLILTSIPWWIVLTAPVAIASIIWQFRIAESGPKDSSVWKLFFGSYDNLLPGQSGSLGLVGMAVASGLVLLAIGLRFAWVKFYEKSPLRGVTKVLGDIFLYLGVPEYRAQLVTTSAKKFEEALNSEVKEVVICAHSLGTVISADVLCTIPDTKAPKSITFISAGSPLHRMFWRFFPALFPPPHDIAVTLRHKHEGFRWVNVHRIFDYVGGSLKLGANGIDTCTGQWWPMHVNYWGDAAPIMRVMDALKTVTVLPREENPPSCHQPMRNSPSTSLHAAKRLMGGIVLIALAVAYPVKRGDGEYRRIVTKKAEVAEYLAAGDKRATRIKVRCYLGEPGDLGIKRLKGQFALTDGFYVRIMDRGLKLNLPNDYLVDTSALRKKMRALGLEKKTASENPQMPFYELEMAGTEVTSKPHLFTIADPPTPSMGKKRLSEFITWGIALLVYCIALGMVWPLFSWLSRFFFPSYSDIKP